MDKIFAINELELKHRMRKWGYRLKSVPALSCDSPADANMAVHATSLSLALARPIAWNKLVSLAGCHRRTWIRAVLECSLSYPRLAQ